MIDFAGGTCVHVCSGASATAYSVYLSHPLFRSRKSSKRSPSHLILHRPHNTLCRQLISSLARSDALLIRTTELLALVFIWGGWLAFDAGTTLALNFRSVNAMATTNLCASSGALTWMLMTCSPPCLSLSRAGRS